MPKRVIDFDAMWGSDKLASCAAWAQGEYAWLYGLADASGCFELTNLRVIWGRVAAIRANLTIERLDQVFAEFQDKGLLFVWEHEGKRYAHWTGSDVPGRLPPPSWRMRLEKFAPPVPKQRLAEYMARFARGRAALAGAGFGGEAARECAGRTRDLKFEISDFREGQEGRLRAPGAQGSGSRAPVADGGEKYKFENSDLRGERECGELKDRVEEAQTQDLGLDWNGNWEEGRDGRRCERDGARVRGGDAGCVEELSGSEFHKSNSSSNSISHLSSKSESSSNSSSLLGSKANAASHSNAASHAAANSHSYSSANFNAHAYDRGVSAKDLAVERELRVGQGPVCGPCGVKPEVIERDRRRQAAARAGSKSP
jgi:hypothetical protein